MSTDMLLDPVITSLFRSIAPDIRQTIEYHFATDPSRPTLRFAFSFVADHPETAVIHFFEEGTSFAFATPEYQQVASIEVSRAHEGGVDGWSIWLLDGTDRKVLSGEDVPRFLSDARVVVRAMVREVCERKAPSHTEQPA